MLCGSFVSFSPFAWDEGDGRDGELYFSGLNKVSQKVGW